MTASHTQARPAVTGICDLYLDDAGKTGLTVLMGGVRKWFLPSTVPGTARSASTDYTLPAELSAGWHIAPGVVDPERDLLSDFVNAGWEYAATATELARVGKVMASRWRRRGRAEHFPEVRERRPLALLPAQAVQGASVKAKTVRKGTSRKRPKSAWRWRRARDD